MPTQTPRTALVIGAGPGLGMSIAHRFGREGYRIALVSRTSARHSGYLESLEAAGIEAGSFPADVLERDELLSAVDAVTDRYGSIDLLYYGPAATDPDAFPTPIAQADSAAVRKAMNWVYPAIDTVGRVLPPMMERRSGAMLFATGLSAVHPLPTLGNLAVSSAALHNYALTLNAALAEYDIYSGSLVIGGAIERGDIHRMLLSRPGIIAEDIRGASLDPDEIADIAWKMASFHDRASTTFNALF